MLGVDVRKIVILPFSKQFFWCFLEYADIVGLALSRSGPNLSYPTRYGISSSAKKQIHNDHILGSPNIAI